MELMETDEYILETMILDFSNLSKRNKEKIIAATRLLLHTQNSVVPEILTIPSPLLEKHPGIKSSSNI